MIYFIGGARHAATVKLFQPMTRRIEEGCCPKIFLHLTGKEFAQSQISIGKLERGARSRA